MKTKKVHLGVLELPKDQSHWVGHGRDVALMFGFSRSTFWVRFALDHAGDEKQQIVMESLDPSSDFIEIFVFDKRGRLLANVKSGDQTESFSINAKNIRNRYPAFLVELTEPVDIYVSLKGRSPLKFDLQLANPDNFYDRRLHDFGLNLMVLGIGIFLFFYNLFLYIQVRETVYIPY